MNDARNTGKSRFADIVIPGSLTATPAAELEWEKLGFSVTITRSMAGTVAGADGVFEDPVVVPSGLLAIPAHACALNYGQSMFEGMKARRGVDGTIRLFRPLENAKRMANGAARFLMACPSEELFLKAVVAAVKANIDYVPPYGKGSLYIRPLLSGIGSTLAPAPAPETLFVVYVQPVGSYFKGLACIDVRVEEQVQRAAARGTGWVKAAGNYAPAFKPAKEAKAAGFADTLFLDHSGTLIEEVGAANFAMVKDGVLYVADSPSILKGITRDSVMRIARERLGLEVVFAPLELDRVLGRGAFAAAGPADEAFCMGTAAVISPIGSMTASSGAYTFGTGDVGSVTARLFDELDGIQTGRLPDPFGWTMQID
ncbi:MAG: branched-chain amino acid aminotransferase [Spirochaetales bacterium]|nr:branched-chain amino acid aminotransferase [Spirochaetales bacterium]